jgi:hypothetical protein
VANHKPPPYENRVGDAAATARHFENIERMHQIELAAVELKRRVDEMEEDIRGIRRDTGEILHLLRSTKIGTVVLLGLLGLVSTILVAVEAWIGIFKR